MFVRTPRGGNKFNMLEQRRTIMRADGSVESNRHGFAKSWINICKSNMASNVFLVVFIPFLNQSSRKDKRRPIHKEETVVEDVVLTL